MSDWNPLQGTDWDPLLRPEFEEPYWDELQAFVKEERSLHRVYPPHEEVFAALHLTSYAETKVVILGQDPYHGEAQAHGLCFSVGPRVAMPPSLIRIHRELERDLGLPRPDHGSHEPWARRGVLLLNAVLTVREGEPGSHQHMGWERLTDAVIRVVAEKTPPVVFMLWGREAQKKAMTGPADIPPKMIIESPHPMARPPKSFLGSRSFSRANSAVVADGRDEIDWSLDGTASETLEC